MKRIRLFIINFKMFIYEEHLNLDTKISEQVDEKNTHLLIFLKKLYRVIFFPIIVLDFLFKELKHSKDPTEDI